MISPLLGPMFSLQLVGDVAPEQSSTVSAPNAVKPDTLRSRDGPAEILEASSPDQALVVVRSDLANLYLRYLRLPNGGSRFTGESDCGHQLIFGNSLN